MVAWQEVCSPVRLGGLGIPNLRLLNAALRDKWLWLQRMESDRPGGNSRLGFHPWPVISLRLGSWLLFAMVRAPDFSPICGLMVRVFEIWRRLSLRLGGITWNALWLRGFWGILGFRISTPISRRMLLPSSWPYGIGSASGFWWGVKTPSSGVGRPLESLRFSRPIMLFSRAGWNSQPGT